MKSQPKSGAGPSVQSAFKALRILIVDDHAIVRDGLRQILAGAFPKGTFGEARNSGEAFEQLSKQPWDAVLLDISMPGQSGVDILKQMISQQPNLKVLVLTMHPEEQYAMRVLRAGASGYLTKESASAEVVNAVTKILSGKRYVSQSLAEHLAEGLHQAKPGAPHERLSDREYQVLRLLGAGKSVKEIAFDLSLSAKTVSTYRSRVLTKLSLKSNAEIIRYALREKLVE